MGIEHTAAEPFANMSKHVLILAGDRLQAEFIARDKGLRRDQWTYACAPRHVYGRNGDRHVLWRYGSYNRRSDWREVSEIARHRGIEVLDVLDSHEIAAAQNTKGGA